VEVARSRNTSSTSLCPLGRQATQAQAQRMAPAVLAGQGIGLERAAGGKGAAKPRLPQRLWWRFVDAGDEGPAVQQLHSLLASSLGVAIGEVLSQSLAGSSDSGLARLQKVGCGLLDRHARGRLVREHLAPEGAAAAVWASLTDASNRMWVRAGPAPTPARHGRSAPAAATLRCRPRVGARPELRVLCGAQGGRGAERRPAARLPGGPWQAAVLWTHESQQRGRQPGSRVGAVSGPGRTRCWSWSSRTMCCGRSPAR